MIPRVVAAEAEKVGTRYKYAGNVIQGMKPAESMFGYTYFAHMVPPFKPGHTLMLGYGVGTVADLMRRVWGGQVKITGVDCEAQNYDYVEHRMKVMDAKEFIWDCTKDSFFRGKIPLFPKERFDYVCVDLWDGGVVPDFVFEVEFVVRLREIETKLMCMNVGDGDVKRTRAYYDYGFRFDRVVPIEGNRVMWWSVVGDR